MERIQFPENITVNICFIQNFSILANLYSHAGWIEPYRFMKLKTGFLLTRLILYNENNMKENTGCAQA